MSGESRYTCKVCSKVLPVGAFSKSQVNKLEHNKIDAIKCISCTNDLLPESERIGKQREKDQTQQENKIKAVVAAAVAKTKTKTFDPSMQYIKDPKSAPIIKDATSFAESHGLQYPVQLGPINGWRTVVKMAVRGVLKKNFKSGKDYVHTSIGLFKPGSHEVASCLTSTAHHPAINQALARIDDARRTVGLNGYIEGTGHVTANDLHESSDAAEAASVKFNCLLKYVLLVLARQTGTVQLSLVWNSEPSGDAAGERVLDAFVKRLLEPSTAAPGAKDANKGDKKPQGQSSDSRTQKALFHSIWVNYNPSSRYSNAITGRGEDSWRLLYGEQYAEEIVRTDMTAPPVLRFPPFVFRQANICAFTKIICNVRHWVKDLAQQRLAAGTGPSGGKRQKTDAKTTQGGSVDPSGEMTADIRCVELYAGVGTIGLNCLDLLADLNCSDENPHNLACFEAARAAIEPAALRERAAYRPQAAAVVAQSGGLRGYDLVLVDPPRKGLDDEVIAALLEYQDDGTRKNDGSGDGRVGEKRRKDTQTSPVRNNERLIYVSCGFPAFKRDAARLLGQAPISAGGTDRGGVKGKGHRAEKKNTGNMEPVGVSANQGNVRYWKLVHLEGHVLFPGSDHIETLAVFDRV